MEFADELGVNLVFVPIMRIVTDHRISQMLILKISVVTVLEDAGGFRLKDRFTCVRLLT